MATYPRRSRYRAPGPPESSGQMWRLGITGGSQEPRRRPCKDRASNPSLRRGTELCSTPRKRETTLFCGRGSGPLRLIPVNSLTPEAAGSRLFTIKLLPQKTTNTGVKGSFQGSWVVIVAIYMSVIVTLQPLWNYMYWTELLRVRGLLGGAIKHENSG